MAIVGCHKDLTSKGLRLLTVRMKLTYWSSRV